MADRLETIKKTGNVAQTVVAVSSLIFIFLGLYAVLFSGMPTYFIPQSIPNVFILMGVLIFLCSLGGIGALMVELNSVFMMQLGMLFVLILVQLAFSINSLTFATPSTVDPTISPSQLYIHHKWLKYYKHNPQLISSTQHHYSCCGLTTPTDHAFPKSSPTACIDSKNFGYTHPCLPYITSEVEVLYYGVLGIGGVVVSGLCLIMVLVMFYFVLMKWPTVVELESTLLYEHERLLRETERREDDEGEQDVKKARRHGGGGLEASREERGFLSGGGGGVGGARETDIGGGRSSQGRFTAQAFGKSTNNTSFNEEPINPTQGITSIQRASKNIHGNNNTPSLHMARSVELVDNMNKNMIDGHGPINDTPPTNIMT